MTHLFETSEAGRRAADEELRRAASAVRDEMRETARSVFERNRRAAAARLHGISAGLRESAGSLRAREEGRGAAPLVQRAADGLERMAATLEREDARSLLAQAEEFARRHPSAFLGAAAAAGFAFARFLRSSSARRGLERFEDRRREASPSLGRARSGGEASGRRTL